MLYYCIVLCCIVLVGAGARWPVAAWAGWWWCCSWWRGSEQRWAQERLHAVTQCCHHQERQFEISKEDHLNIQLAEAVGVRHLAVSYPQVPVHSRYTVWRRLTLTQDINCTLARATADSELLRVCTNVSVPVCRWGMATRALNKSSRRFHNHEEGSY